MPGFYALKQAAKVYGVLGGLHISLVQLHNALTHGLCNPFTQQSCPLFAVTLAPPNRVEFDSARLPPMIQHTTNETEVSISVTYNGTAPDYWTRNDTKATFILEDQGEHLNFWHSKSSRMPIVVKPWSSQPEPNATLDHLHDEDFTQSSSPLHLKAHNNCISTICKAFSALKLLQGSLWGLLSSLLFELMFRYLRLCRFWRRVVGWIYYPSRRRRASEKPSGLSVEYSPPLTTPGGSVTQDQSVRIEQLERREALLQSYYEKRMISQRQEHIRAVVLQNWKIGFLEGKRLAETDRILSLESQNSQLHVINRGRNDRILTMHDRLNTSNAKMTSFNKREIGLSKRLMQARSKLNSQRMAKEKAQADENKMRKEVAVVEKRAHSLQGQKVRAEESSKVYKQISEEGRCQIRELGETVTQQSSKIESLEATMSAVEAAKSQFQHENDELQAELDSERQRLSQQVKRIDDTKAARSTAETEKSRLQHVNQQLQARIKTQRDIPRQQAEQAQEEIAQKTKLALDIQAQLEMQAASFNEQTDDFREMQTTLDRIAAHHINKLERQAAELRHTRDELQLREMKLQEMAEAADEKERATNELQEKYDMIVEQLRCLKRSQRGKKRKPARVELETELIAAGSWEPSLVLPSPESLSKLSIPTIDELSAQSAPAEPVDGAQSRAPIEDSYEDITPTVKMSFPRGMPEVGEPPRWKKTRRGTRGGKKTRLALADDGEHA